MTASPAEPCRLCGQPIDTQWRMETAPDVRTCRECFLKWDNLTDCPVFRPDHNGECLNCDERIEAHTPEAIAAGERAAE
jgi:hypothetical protein